VSDTTCHPLFMSIAGSGEWSMRRVLDGYFQFAAGGDFYLSQLLTLKDQNSVELDTPFSHWHDPNNPVVVEALELTFGRILMEHCSRMHSPLGVFSIWLVSMVHHSDWMFGVLEIDPLSSHLLHKLMSHHLTLELNTHIPTTTGISPHIAHLCNITTVKGCCKHIKAAILEFKGEFRETVSQAIDDKVEESEGIHASILDSRIQALDQS